jgi:transposase InsO family protein
MSRSRFRAAAHTILRIFGDVSRFASTAVRSHAQLAAENVFLRKQLALYVERQMQPERADDAARIVLVALARLIDWRCVLTVVKPDTLIRWHRKGFRLFWRRKSRPRGRPRMPSAVQGLIAQMAAANHTWGEERIAAELLLKLGIQLSPRTVRRYMATRRAPRGGARSQLWSTFVRNHASAVLACDFFVAITATFRVLYVFVVLEVGTRRIRHWNVTDHPTAEWTAQQFRMVMSGEEPHRFIHDRDGIYSDNIDGTIAAMGLTILKTPLRSPTANAFCERLIGTMRRECLDWLIPLNEAHLRRVLEQWVAHYNRGRPHASLGPGIPDAPDLAPELSGHRIRDRYQVVAQSILGGLHHEYRLQPRAASPWSHRRRDYLRTSSLPGHRAHKLHVAAVAALLGSRGRPPARYDLCPTSGGVP